MEEVWKVVSDCPNYAVSNLGRVKRIKEGRGTYPGKILNPGVCTTNGYQVIALIRGGKFVWKTVHQLVLDEFLGRSTNKGLVCNHKDGDKQNNRVENLERVTQKENIQHALRMGLSKQDGENNPSAKLKRGEVWLIKRLFENRIKHKLISKMFKVSVHTIYHIKYGQTWRSI